MAIGMSFFTPFIEAPAVAPLKPDPDMSGSNTIDIDHLRQGVEIVTDRQRFAGTLPKLETGDPEHQLELTVFGQSSEFTANVLFEEIVRFDPVAFIENNETLIYPVVLDNVNYEDPELLGGFIQPLSIQSRDLLPASTEFEPHDIRALLMDGNESVFRNSNRIVSQVDRLEPSSSADLYIDASDYMGDGLNVVNLGGLFPEQERQLRPFNESAFLSRTFRSGSLAGDIATALISMSNDSDTYIVDAYRSAGTGFTFDNSLYGTDSIAFGGLKRS